MANKESLKIGDRVKSTQNAFGVEYIVEKIFKTCCWVRIAPGHGWETTKGGKTFEELVLYKGVHFSSITKVKEHG